MIAPRNNRARGITIINKPGLSDVSVMNCGMDSRKPITITMITPMRAQFFSCHNPQASTNMTTMSTSMNRAVTPPTKLLPDFTALASPPQPSAIASRATNTASAVTMPGRRGDSSFPSCEPWGIFISILFPFRRTKLFGMVSMCDERLINRTEADYKEDSKRHNPTSVPIYSSWIAWSRSFSILRKVSFI